MQLLKDGVRTVNSGHYVPLRTLMVRFDQNNFRLNDNKKKDYTWLADGECRVGRLKPPLVLLLLTSGSNRL